MDQVIIHIDWDGPYDLDLISQGELNDDKQDYGVYQIYGEHPVYGVNVLLYIGKADQQTFKKRILQEEWEYQIADLEMMRVYAGRIAGPKTPSEKTWSRKIELAEKLLIHSHKPAYNSQNIKTIPDAELRKVHVLNWANRASLLPEVSGYRWTDRLDDMPRYAVYRLR